jgi:hypothetical protein
MRLCRCDKGRYITEDQRFTFIKSNAPSLRSKAISTSHWLVIDNSGLKSFQSSTASGYDTSKEFRRLKDAREAIESIYKEKNEYDFKSRNSRMVAIVKGWR